MSLSVAPVTRSLRIAPSGFGLRICPSTTPRTESRSSPSARLARKASSRFGPTIPLVLARARVWQEPHLATNACLPRIRLALSAPLTEQPVAPIASASSRAPAAPRAGRPRRRAPGGRRERWSGCAKLMSGRNTIRRGGWLDGRPSAVLRRFSWLLQAVQFAVGRRDHAARHAIPGPPFAHRGDQPGTCPRAELRGELQPVHDALSERCHRAVVHGEGQRRGRPVRYGAG